MDCFIIFFEHTGQNDQPTSVCEWKLKSYIGDSYGPGKIEGQACVAFTPDDDIVILDERTDEVKIYDARDNCKYKSSFSPDIRDVTTTGIYISSIAVDLIGNIYVAGDKFVVASDKYGKSLGKWVPVPPAGIKATHIISSMTIDVEGNLLMGCEFEYFNGYISKHKVNGDHIHSLKLPLQPASIASTPEGTVAVCDRKCVQIVSQSGEVLHTLQHTDMKQPSGVCCSKDMILVCDSYMGEVFCFSLSAQFIGHKQTESNSCRFIAVNQDGTKLGLGSYAPAVYELQ